MSLSKKEKAQRKVDEANALSNHDYWKHLVTQYLNAQFMYSIGRTTEAELTEEEFIARKEAITPEVIERCIELVQSGQDWGIDFKKSEKDPGFSG